jgi:hypothetical protein
MVNGGLSTLFWCRWRVYASAYPVSDILPAEELEQLAVEETEEAKRAKAIASREEVYQATLQELAKIQPFENVVRFLAQSQCMYVACVVPCVVCG